MGFVDDLVKRVVRVRVETVALVSELGGGRGATALMLVDDISGL